MPLIQLLLVSTKTILHVFHFKIIITADTSSTRFIMLTTKLTFCFCAATIGSGFILMASRLSGYTPHVLKPPMTFAGVAEACEKRLLKLNLVTTLPGLHRRKVWHTI